MNSEKISLSREMYSKEALMKAAYSFLDRAYVYLDQDEKHWVVNMCGKNCDVNSLLLEFKNEILAQEVRRLVYKKTHPIRELLLARAMASSLVSEEDPVKQVRAEEDSISDEELATIMKDWYKQDGN